ncbi:MAG: peptidylprolyl isomerase [Ruminococcus flavefaciens]
MKGNKTIVRSVLIFTLIMGAMSLLVMLNSNIRQKNNNYITVDPETMELVQLDGPREGDPIAIVDTTLGEFRFVLYPQYCPNAVKNFTDLAEQGYYNGTYVFNSDSGAYSAAGAPNKDGTVNDSSHEVVERELHENLWPFKGAVCAMTTTVDKGVKEFLFGGGTYYNGSRFALINTIEFDDQMKADLREVSASQKLAEAFIEKGGIPNFSQQMTVIGQTYQGMDVIEKLSALETENKGPYKIPKDDIMIISVTIDKYGEENADADK